VFFGFYLQFPWFRVLFPSAVLAAFLFVLGGAAEVPDSGQSAMRLILLFGVAVNFIQVGLFCFLIAIGRTFRLRWHFAPLGIILGFTASALGSAIGFWSRSEFGTKFVILADYAPPVAYILANFIWLDTFLRPEPEPQWISAATMNQIAEQLRRDSVMLKKIMERLK
jgi:drug/metabolite transporter (DMT)-like permease